MILAPQVTKVQKQVCNQCCFKWNEKSPEKIKTWLLHFTDFKDPLMWRMVRLSGSTRMGVTEIVLSEYNDREEALISECLIFQWLTSKLIAFLFKPYQYCLFNLTLLGCLQKLYERCYINWNFPIVYELWICFLLQVAT